VAAIDSVTAMGIRNIMINPSFKFKFMQITGGMSAIAAIKSQMIPCFHKVRPRDIMPYPRRRRRIKPTSMMMSRTKSVVRVATNPILLPGKLIVRQESRTGIKLERSRTTVWMKNIKFVTHMRIAIAITTLCRFQTAIMRSTIRSSAVERAVNVKIQ